MLRVLLASQPARAGWLGGTAFSTLTHGALIALAVIATKEIRYAPHEERASAPTEHTVYIEMSRLVEAHHTKAVVRTPKATKRTPPPKQAPNFMQYAEAISA